MKESSGGAGPSTVSNSVKSKSVSKKKHKHSSVSPESKGEFITQDPGIRVVSRAMVLNKREGSAKTKEKELANDDYSGGILVGKKRTNRTKRAP